MTKLSLIINTACLDPIVAAKGNIYRTSGYGERERILEMLLESEGFDEIIVAGSYKPGDGYVYIATPPAHRDRRDALRQREVGARMSTGDILVFTHDDHILGEGFADNLRKMADGEWDIYIPKRVHGITGEELNNGKDDDYMGGHALVMKRWVWAKVPWDLLDTEWWDVSMTRIWREKGAKLMWTDELEHIDMEASADES